MEEEIWRPAPGIEDRYEISSHGRMRSKPRIGWRGKFIESHLLNPYKAKDGYWIIKLPIDGRKKQFNIHRLVALAFIPNPENKPEVNHLKGKNNNQADALEWATGKENAEHAVKNRLQYRKLGDNEVGMIWEYYPKYTKEFLSNLFGVHPLTIYQIACLNARKHVKGAPVPTLTYGAKKIINIVTGQVYSSMKEIAVLTGKSYSHYKKRLGGQRKNTTPYRYLEDFQAV